MRPMLTTAVMVLALFMAAAGPGGADAAHGVEGQRPDLAQQPAYGCNGQVCISLTGSGLVVSSWTTTASPTSYTCSTPRYWRNGVLIATGPQRCGGAGTTLHGSYGSGVFNDGDVLCNTWTGISGQPCKTIHQ